MVRSKRTLLLAALLILTLALTGTVASARPPAQEEVSEDLALLLNLPVGGPRVSDVIGDDADEDGYTGAVNTAPPVQAPSEAGDQAASPRQSDVTLQPDDAGYAGPAVSADASPALSSEEPPAEAPNWEQFFAEPQPDQNSYYDDANGETRSPEDWSNFHYIHVAGATLRTRDSSSGWDYSGVGCVSLANGGELLNIHLNIPNGSRIDYLRIYYYDASANNSTAWVTNYDDAGAYTDLVSVASSGSAGYGTQLSSLLSHVVNTSSRSYVLNWDANQTGNTMRLCGLRVAYRLPV